MPVTTSLIYHTDILFPEKGRPTRPALVIHVDEDDTSYDFRIGRNGKGTWDVAVDVEAKSFNDARFASRDHITDVAGKFPNRGIHSIPGHQLYREYNVQGLAFRRAVCEGIGDSDLSELTDRIFRSIGIEGDDLRMIGQEVADYRAGVLMAELRASRSFMACFADAFRRTSPEAFSTETPAGRAAVHYARHVHLDMT